MLTRPGLDSSINSGSEKNSSLGKMPVFRPESSKDDPPSPNLSEENLDELLSPPSSFIDSLLDKFKKIIPIGLGILVVGLVVYAGTRYLPKGFQKFSSSVGSVFKSRTTSSSTPTPGLESTPNTDNSSQPNGSSGQNSASTPTPETGPTAGWQTLTKGYQNYEIRVPSDWKIEVYNEDSKMFAQTLFFPPGFQTYPMEIGADYIRNEREKGKSLKECADYWLEYYLTTTPEISPLGPFVAKDEGTTVTGRSGAKYTIGFKKSGRKDVWIYFARTDDDDYLYKIIARDVNDDFLQKFDLMIGSFKFLDNVPQTKIS